MKQDQDLRERIKDNDRKEQDAFLNLHGIVPPIRQPISHQGRGLAGVVPHSFHGGKNIFENDLICYA